MRTISRNTNWAKVARGYFLAGLAFAFVWAFLMKASDGFSKPWPTIGTIAFMIVSFGLLSMAMKTLPLGTAYAIWTGIGAVGAFVVGVMVLGEALTPMRIGGVVLIVSGLVVLKLSSSH